jgi:hypothetical protein
MTYVMLVSDLPPTRQPPVGNPSVADTSRAWVPRQSHKTYNTGISADRGNPCVPRVFGGNNTEEQIMCFPRKAVCPTTAPESESRPSSHPSGTRRAQVRDNTAMTVGVAPRGLIQPTLPRPNRLPALTIVATDRQRLEAGNLRGWIVDLDDQLGITVVSERERVSNPTRPTAAALTRKRAG